MRPIADTALAHFTVDECLAIARYFGGEHVAVPAGTTLGSLAASGARSSSASASAIHLNGALVAWSSESVATRRSYLEIPREWERLAVRRVGAFVTSETFRRPDGRSRHVELARAPRSADAARERARRGGRRTPWRGGSVCSSSSDRRASPSARCPGYLAWVGYEPTQ